MSVRAEISVATAEAHLVVDGGTEEGRAVIDRLSSACYSEESVSPEELAKYGLDAGRPAMVTAFTLENTMRRGFGARFTLRQPLGGLLRAAQRIPGGR